MPEYTVGAVADLLGVSVRTLHHYDGIGLAGPSARSVGGYRLYSPDDIDRLRRVLSYRELGFGLDDIARLVDGATGRSAAEHLERQRGLLTARIDRLRRMVAAIDTELEAHHIGIALTPEEKSELFGDFDPDAHEAEAVERWGDTDAHRESRRRTSSYDAADWQRIQAEGRDVEQRLAGLLAAGTPPDSPAAAALAEEHRQHICRSYYDCPHDMHQGLADMYVADERFTAHYEAVAPGLAAFLAAAIRANAAAAAR